MATVIVSDSDFKGRFSIAFPTMTGDKYAELSYEIERIEKQVLIDLFGLDLFNDFALSPTDPSFAPLYLPMVENGLYSEGITATIVAFIYLRLSTDAYFMATINGRISKSAENGEIMTPVTRDIKLYNEYVDAWKALRSYCARTYDKYKGKDKDYRFY